MKWLNLLCIVICIWVVPVKATAGEELPWEKKLPFKNAALHYLISGMEEGKESLYIRDYGKERATYHETVTKMMGMTITNSTAEFKTPDFIYSYDLLQKEGFKGSNPQKYMLEEYNKLSGADKQKVLENAQKMGMVYTEGMGGTVEQNATEILGYSCDKVEIVGGAVSYLIHGTDVALKTEMDMMGMKMDIVATSIETGKIDDKFFQHPAGITPGEDARAETMARQMSKEAVAMLLNPEKANQSQGAPFTLPGGMGELSEEDKQKMEQAEQMMQGFQKMLKQQPTQSQ